MAEQRTLVEKLLSTRADYEAERARHKFLLDAYAGTGGFRGAVRMTPASYWGWAADAYSGATLNLFNEDTDQSVDSYIDRFPREDVSKWKRRVQVAQYPNYCANIVDIPLSYMSRKEFRTEGLPKNVEEWSEDVDGRGTTFDEMMRDMVRLRAMVVGYCPVMWEVSGLVAEDGSEPVGEMSMAQFEAMGMRINSVAMFPANLLDWEHDENGELTWMKVKTKRCIRPSPLVEGVTFERVTILFRDRVEIYDIAQGKTEKTVVRHDIYAHSFGTVPMTILRWKPVPKDPVRGISAIESVATLAKRLFNYISELDEHIRQSVFAMLQIPMRGSDQQLANELMVGNNQGLPLHQDSQRDYKWIAPPESVAKTLEGRIKVTREEMFRQGRVEFVTATTGGGGNQARSGISRQFEFENTNRAIADFARRDARFQERSLFLVASVLPGELRDTEFKDSPIRVHPPEKFSVEEVERELADAEAAITLDLGPMATAELKKKIVRTVLPNLTDEKLDEIDAEIDQGEADRKAQAEALARATSSLGNPDDDEDDEDEDEEPPTPPAPPEE